MNQRGNQHAHDIASFLKPRMALCVFVLYAFDFEDVERIHVRTAEARRAGRFARDRAAVAQDVNIGEGDVHRHRAERAALGVKVKAVARPVAAVAALGAAPLDKRDADLGARHAHTSPKKRRISASAVSGASEPWMTL